MSTLPEIVMMGTCHGRSSLIIEDFVHGGPGSSTELSNEGIALELLTDVLVLLLHFKVSDYRM